MKRFLVVAAAFTLLLSGCGKEEEPQMKQAEESAMEQPAGAMMEGAPTEETMQPEAPMGEEPAMETAPEAANGMTEEAAPQTDEAAPATDEPAADITSESEQANAPMQVAQAEGDRGKQVYDMTCFACHAQGIAGAPKIGDKAAWEQRIAQGMDTMVSHAINGFQGSSGVMPPKGGRMDLSDADVQAAVAYMVGQSK